MSRPGNLDAVIAADQTLDELGLAKDEPVDVFSAISMLGLQLAIVPLDGLLGAMLPQGSGGVLVTSERNARLQRYTAAHEIGHWILHRVEPAVDTEREILHGGTERERQAQLFAAYFLMPPPLVDGVVARYDMRAHRVEPEHVYLASRDMHVSYEAAAYRLYTHRMISGPRLAELNAVNRLDAMKRQFGRRPADGHADLWQQQYSSEPDQVEVAEHDEVIIALPEQRASGWRWLNATQLRDRGRHGVRRRPLPPPAPHTATLELQPPEPIYQEDLRRWLSPASTDAQDRPVRVIADDFTPTGIPTSPRELAQARQRVVTSARRSPSAVDAGGNDAGEPLVGGAGVRSLVVRGDAPGEATVELYYAHAYDPGIDPVLTYQLTLRVQPTPTTAYRAERIHSADLDLRLDDDPDDNASYPVVPS